jgi:hypothetical protein
MGAYELYPAVNNRPYLYHTQKGSKSGTKVLDSQFRTSHDSYHINEPEADTNDPHLSVLPRIDRLTND